MDICIIENTSGFLIEITPMLNTTIKLRKTIHMNTIRRNGENTSKFQKKTYYIYLFGLLLNVHTYRYTCMRSRQSF